MDKKKASYLEGTISIIVNIGLFAVKLWAGMVSGSIALIADAWHTLSDSISSLIVIVGAKLSSKKPDEKHPFGHGRWEYISSIFISFLLGIIAFSFITDAIDSFKAKDVANFGTIAIVVTIVSILVKEALAQYAFYLGRKTDSSTLKADGWHHRTDAISSVIILVGIFFKDSFWWIDSVLGVIVSLMLFYAAFEIIKDSISKLLGEQVDDKIIQKVEAIINAISEEDIVPHRYQCHNYVSHKELTFHIKMENSTELEAGHDLATKIEEKIFEELGIQSTIHIEPKDFKHKFD